MGITLGMAAAAAPAPSSTSRTSRVVVVRNAGALDAKQNAQSDVIARMLAEGLQAFAGTATAAEAWKRFFRPDDAVAIKATVMMTPTHPELIRAIMEGLATVGIAGEKIRVWDRDSGGTGPAQAAPATWKWRPGFDDNSISRAVVEATALINVPGLKSHWLSGFGGALKNWCGAVTGINPPDKNVVFSFHSDSCAEMAMLNALPPIRQKCRLIVVDALRALCNGGPAVDPRYLWPYKGLLIGTDPVAVDSVGLKIVQGKRDQMRGSPWPLSPPPKHIAVAAEKYKLGTADLAQIEIVRLGWEEDSFV
jgi:hypothetical protein